MDILTQYAGIDGINKSTIKLIQISRLEKMTEAHFTDLEIKIKQSRHAISPTFQ